MRFSTILNNFCNSKIQLHPFEYDVLHIYALLPTEFVRILWWRCGEIVVGVGSCCFGIQRARARAPYDPNST